MALFWHSHGVMVNALDFEFTSKHIEICFYETKVLSTNHNIISVTSVTAACIEGLRWNRKLCGIIYITKKRCGRYRWLSRLRHSGVFNAGNRLVQMNRVQLFLVLLWQNAFEIWISHNTGLLVGHCSTLHSDWFCNDEQHPHLSFATCEKLAVRSGIWTHTSIGDCDLNAAP